MKQNIEFDEARARTYEKYQEVLAFQSGDAFCFRKPWGEQNMRSEGWVIVPLDEDGRATRDLYGCDADVFARTYEQSPSLRPNRYRKNVQVRAYQPGVAFEVDTVLPDGHREVSRSGTGSVDAWIVRAPGGEVYPVEHATFRRTYREVPERTGSYRIRTRDEHWSADGSPKRILSLDGGGVRGIFTLGYLERIEELLRQRHGRSPGFRLCHYFDLIAGTSTGAIIAACLAKGMAVKEIQELYRTMGRKVFRRSLSRKGVLRPRYSEKRLQRLLEDHFEDNTLGSHSLQTGLLVVTKRLDTGSVWPLSNNPNDPYFTKKSGETFLSNEDYLLRRVVRASTAAPSFFRPEQIEIARQGKNRKVGVFVDGGVSPHNNPSLMALELVALHGFGLNWSLDPDRLLLVSVGTGASVPGTSHSYGAAHHAVNSLRSLMDDCAEQVEALLQWLSNSPMARRIDSAVGHLGHDLLAERPLLQYLRYNVLFTAQWLKQELGIHVGEPDIRKLGSMDRPDAMPLLADIGRKAAHHQIDDTHFPVGFDLD